MRQPLPTEPDFEEARVNAILQRLLLRRCTEFCYQLRDVENDRIVDIYPGKQRIVHNVAGGRHSTFIVLPTPWTLTDVVSGYAETRRKGF